ncbi:hypothetical protein UFOVP67_64 [uncultured Caudovirales phage]|uniref:Uncharacterized protein n=1 Tax=uncultured Caudovirales phage TaxID=2100421 RepID=A0A6J5TCS7_9CAUD|nr:hypothetical protein UFOVP67_64 [uncultured Caudovirales phage]
MCYKPVSRQELKTWVRRVYTSQSPPTSDTTSRFETDFLPIKNFMLSKVVCDASKADVIIALMHYWNSSSTFGKEGRKIEGSYEDLL